MRLPKLSLDNRLDLTVDSHSYLAEPDTWNQHDKRDGSPGSAGTRKVTDALPKPIRQRRRAIQLSCRHPHCCRPFQSAGRCEASMGEDRRSFREVCMEFVEHQALYNIDRRGMMSNARLVGKFFDGMVFADIQSRDGKSVV